MNREILFRGKRIDNGEWVGGYVVKDDITGQVFIHAQGNSVNESQKIREEGCLRFVAFEIIPETLCQYTGLTDKNGKKIWENDIVKRDLFGDEVAYGKIVWRVIGFTGFALKIHIRFYPIGRGMSDDEEGQMCCDEVIGNIFDNPELLKED